MKITVIGAGAMGGAFIEGLLESGFPASDIYATRRRAELLSSLADRGVRTGTDNRRAVEGADIVVLAVKPWILPSVAEEIYPHLTERQIVISFAAGIPGDDLKRMLPGTNPLFTVIPNTAIAVCQSMTFIVPVRGTEDRTDVLLELFSTLGKATLTDEGHLGAATALASCGIAYAMRYIRAASEGGVELGFKAPEATEIVLQTVKGAAELLLRSGNHPEAEIDKVCTPGGITIRGLNEMEHAGFTSAVIKGLKAAK